MGNGVILGRSNMRTVLILLSSIPALAAAADPDVLAAYNQLRNVQIDSGRVAVAENLAIRREGGEFLLKTGTLYALQPVLDKVPGVVFIGEGVFTAQPPDEGERQHLARLMDGQTRIEEPFKEAVFLFSGGDYSDFSAGARFKPAAVESRAAGVLGDLRKLFRDHLHRNVEARLLAGLYSEKQAYFLADIHGQKLGRLLYSIDPMDEEMVSVTRAVAADRFDIWMAYDPAGAPNAAARALVDGTRTVLDTQVDAGAKLTGEARLEYSALQDGPRMLLALLAPSLRVAKALSGGAPASFIQEDKDKDADLWLALPAPLVKGRTYSWDLAYAGGDVIETSGRGNFLVGERESWYPKLDVPGLPFNDRVIYRMTFHTPKAYTLVATGNPISAREDGKFSITEWDTEVPYTVAGFNYGEYKSKAAKNGDQEVKVYANPQLPEELEGLRRTLDNDRQLAVATGITTGGFNTTSLMNQTLSESAAALGLFSDYFGPLPFRRFSITQQPDSRFGQSWPTLVFMPYTAFLDATTRHQLGLDQGRSRQFYEEVGSHELAHQWWGHLLSWSSYRDQWLSEGFAQFSAGLFIHRSKGEKDLRAFLEADRNSILGPLPRSTGRANDAGPIWLGSRLETDKTEGAYRLIYSKGGFVLHMLRMMMYDFAKSDDSRFIAMMRDFVRTYSGKAASTADFKAICDKHFGMDMDAFFKQWVYRTEIPKIRIDYSLTGGPSNAVLVLDVTQRDVPDGFVSKMPIILRTKGGVMLAALTISKSQMHTELKLPEKPDSVEFNPLYSLLCELDVNKR